MSVIDIILGVVIVVLGIILIILILMQQGKRAGVSSAVAGGSETFISGAKNRTKDATLKRFTKYIAIALFVIFIITNIYAFFR